MEGYDEVPVITGADQVLLVLAASGVRQTVDHACVSNHQTDRCYLEKSKLNVNRRKNGYRMLTTNATNLVNVKFPHDDMAARCARENKFLIFVNGHR